MKPCDLVIVLQYVKRKVHSARAYSKNINYFIIVSYFSKSENAYLKFYYNILQRSETADNPSWVAVHHPVFSIK